MEESVWPREGHCRHIYLVLANLTVDENKRELLYTRTQTEAGEDLRLDPPVVPLSRGFDADADGDDAMDTSM